MRVDSVANLQYINQGTKIGNASGQVDGYASFAAILNTETTQAAPVGSSIPKDTNQADFTNMTRKEMFDWMNDQLRNGKMTVDESLPFLGMTLKISAATGQEVDMATDTEHINFVEKARLGLEWALSRNGQKTAKMLQKALEIMHRDQGAGNRCASSAEVR